jgi:hypothetical protein
MVRDEVKAFTAAVTTGDIKKAEEALRADGHPPRQGRRQGHDPQERRRAQAEPPDQASQRAQGRHDQAPRPTPAKAPRADAKAKAAGRRYQGRDRLIAAVTSALCAGHPHRAFPPARLP